MHIKSGEGSVDGYGSQEEAEEAALESAVEDDVERSFMSVDERFVSKVTRLVKKKRT